MREITFTGASLPLVAPAPATPTQIETLISPVCGARRGTAAVEFAVVLPTLLLIVLATIDLSRMAHASYAMSNALRAGAEVAATRQFTTYSRAQWETDVRAAVEEHLQHSLGAPAAAVEIDLTTTPVADDLHDISLEATLPLPATANWPGFGGTYVLVEQFQIRQFR